MLNTAKILDYQVWDAETGEADVVAELTGQKNVKVFSLDHFVTNKEYEVRLSLFCKEYEITPELLEFEITNADDKYQVNLQGLIINVSSDDEEGDLIIVDVGNIYINVYFTFNDKDTIQPEAGLFFKGNGRLDIELEEIL